MPPAILKRYVSYSSENEAPPMGTESLSPHSAEKAALSTPIGNDVVTAAQPTSSGCTPPPPARYDSSKHLDKALMCSR